MPIELRILDHKTGFVDHDAMAQLMGYGWLALQKNPKAKTVWACIMRIRDGERISFRWTRDELAAWWTWLVGHLGRDEYSPGVHCKHCPRWHECPAGAAYVRQIGEMIVADAGSASMPLTPARAIDVLDRAKFLVRVCEQIIAGIKTSVASEGGVWSDADGNTLAIDVQEQREILYAQGAAILDEALGGRLPEVVKVGKGKVEEIVKESAPRGMKASAVQGLMDRLEEAGAIAIKTVERLKCKSAPRRLANA